MIYPTSSTQPGVHFSKVSYVNYGLYIPRVKRVRTLLTVYHLNTAGFISIDRFLQNRAPIFYLCFDGIGARHPGMTHRTPNRFSKSVAGCASSALTFPAVPTHKRVDWCGDRNSTRQQTPADASNIAESVLSILSSTVHPVLSQGLSTSCV